jgi:hypothetical protein
MAVFAVVFLLNSLAAREIQAGATMPNHTNLCGLAAFCTYYPAEAPENQISERASNPGHGAALRTARRRGIILRLIPS